MKATCDKCNQLTKINFKETNHPLGVIETYFTCEHCEERYTCFVTDKTIRAKQKEIRKLPGEKNTTKRILLQEEINNRMAILKYDLLTKAFN